jgi:hypothetical protein
MNTFFMHQIKRTNGTFDKGIVVKDTYDAAKQSYHACVGAYAYDHDANTDYVQCMITDMSGTELMKETWIKPEPEPEPNLESEGA